MPQRVLYHGLRAREDDDAPAGGGRGEYSLFRPAYAVGVAGLSRSVLAALPPPGRGCTTERERAGAAPAGKAAAAPAFGALGLLVVRWRSALLLLLGSS